MTRPLQLLPIFVWALIWALLLSGTVDNRFSAAPTMWLIVCAASALVFAPCVPLFERAPRWIEHTPWRGRAIAAILALVAGGATAYVAYVPFGHIPRVQDEVNYYFMGKMFAQGHLWLDAFGAQDFFSYRFFLSGERFYSLFQPGWPVVLAIGHLIGAPWLMGPICIACATLLVYGIGRRLFDTRVALLATALAAFGHAWWFQGGSMMSHSFACLLGLGGVFFALDAYARVAHGSEDIAPERAKSARALFALSGAMFGAMFTVRAATAVALSLPIILTGLYLWKTKRLCVDAILAFAIGLAALGSMQLLYNAILTGSPLEFPQDEYFARTEPSAKCHSLGIGEDIGCPFEHGPDLGRGGFTWAEAVEVTTLRLKQLRWDFFGAGAAIWLLVLQLFSLNAWRARVLLASLSACVMGIYFFYYYHGNFYGARYYFEVLPYLTLLVASSVAILMRCAATLGEEGALKWTGRAVVGAIAATVVAMPYVHVSEVFEERAAYYAKGWQYAKRIHALEASSDLKDAIVITPNEWRGYWQAFGANDGSLQGDRLYVRDWGRDMNARLLDLYPGRKVYRVVRQGDSSAFKEITNLPKREGRIVIEGESVFPPIKRRGGHALPQQLHRWKETARASRGEHLLFEKTDAGDWLEFRVFVLEPGQYTLSARLTRGPDYGIVRLVVEDQVLDPAFDGYDDEVSINSWSSEGSFELHEGWNTVRLEIMGKSADSRGFVAGLDKLTFERVER